MTSRLLVVGVLLLATTLSLAQEHESQGVNAEPLLFVYKKTSSDDIVLGSSVEVVVKVHNYGQNPAFDVTITDLLEDGSEQKVTVDSLPFGATEVLRYMVTPTALGNYPVGVTQVTYNLEQGNPETARVAVGNMIRESDAYFQGEDVDDESFRGVISVLTRERYDRLHARYVKEITAYLFLGIIPALFPYVLYRTKRSQVDALLRRAKRSK